MHVREVAKAIARQLRRDYEVVVSPDHPYLLQGPDLLAGGSDQLLGVFIMRADEYRSPVRLLVRGTLSRLGLPVNTNFVLIASDTQTRARTPHSTWAHIRNMFIRVIDPRERVNWGYVFHRPPFDEQAYNRLLVMQTAAYARAEQYFQHSLRFTPPGPAARSPGRMLREYARSAPSQPVERYSWLTNDFPELPVNQQLAATPSIQLDDKIEEVGGSRLLPTSGTPTTSKAVSSSRRAYSTDFMLQREASVIAAISGYTSAYQFSKFIGLSIQNGYALTNNFPFFSQRTSHSAANALLTSSVPVVHGDPQKVLRALALAGWIIAQPSSSESIYGIVETALHGVAEGSDEQEG